jgi:nucleoporin SEH1
MQIFRQCSSGGVDGSLRTWKAYETLGSHADTVHDVSWAPSIGRSYQLVATACRDQHVRIFKLTPELQQHRQTTSTSATTEKGFRVDLVADLTGHDSEV